MSDKTAAGSPSASASPSLASSWRHCALPSSLIAEQRGAIAVLRLERAEKRNALNLPTVLGIELFFDTLPDSVKAVVIHGAGEHFSAGLDLSEMTEKDASESMLHSRHWHRAFEKIEYGRTPVVSVLHGAVVGGGVELAASTHIRVAEQSTFYALPEGIRGIFVGGGGSVRISRLIGASRMQEMMLTGRTLGVTEGQALSLSHYVTENGEGFAKAMELAERCAKNTPMTNFAITQALPRIAAAAPEAGLLMEAMISAIASSDPEAKARLVDFLEKRAAKVAHD